MGVEALDLRGQDSAPAAGEDLDVGAALGEQVVVFLKPDAEGTQRVYGWFQGKYTLLADLAVRELNGVNYDTFRGQILAALND